MSGGLLIGQPAYVEDMDSPAYQDRLLMKSLGVQAGVVEENDFKVTAGSGLQVEVEKGKAFVEQTKAKQESSNTFYNGLYNLLNPTKQNPYNSVEVSSANPQIAQIIIRVYDVEELGTTGSSFGRIEWLNGSANAGATKAHIEEEKASEYGAAVLPTSSLRLCYVLVPKNATVSSEFSLVDVRRYSGPSLVGSTAHTTSAVVKYGERFISNNNITATLPRCLPGAKVELYNFQGGTTLTVKCQSGDSISGDFTELVGEVKLLEVQHLALVGTTNPSWLITSGEPIREQAYKTLASVTKGEEHISPYPTRPTGVILSVKSKKCSYEVRVGGVTIYGSENTTTPIIIPISFKLLPGKKFEFRELITEGGYELSAEVSYLQE